MHTQPLPGLGLGWLQFKACSGEAALVFGVQVHQEEALVAKMLLDRLKTKLCNGTSLELERNSETGLSSQQPDSNAS